MKKSPKNLSKLSSSSLTIPTNRDFHSLSKSDEFKRPIDELAWSSQSVLETIGGKKSMRFDDPMHLVIIYSKKFLFALSFLDLGG